MLLHGSANLWLAGVWKKKTAESCQVLFAIKVLEHLLACGPAKRTESGFGITDEFDSAHKVFQRTRVIEKTVLTVRHQLGDAGDRGRKHRPAMCHCLHQHERNSLAAAG